MRVTVQPREAGTDKKGTMLRIGTPDFAVLHPGSDESAQKAKETTEISISY